MYWLYSVRPKLGVFGIGFSIGFSIGFGIGYGIGQKYWPIRVSVSVLDLNQNSGFDRSLVIQKIGW